jgi:hypothetical protein
MSYLPKCTTRALVGRSVRQGKASNKAVRQLFIKSVWAAVGRDPCNMMRPRPAASKYGCRILVNNYVYLLIFIIYTLKSLESCVSPIILEYLNAFRLSYTYFKIYFVLSRRELVFLPKLKIWADFNVAPPNKEKLISNWFPKNSKEVTQITIFLISCALTSSRILATKAPTT